jgi:spore germination protein KB
LNAKIGTTQAAMLIVNTILPTATVVLPVIIGNYAEQDAPLAVILSTLIGIGIAMLAGTVVRYTNGKPFLDWIRENSSPVVATILGLLLLQFYLDTSSTILREFINFIKDNVLENTPIPVIVALILFITIYMVRQGIEAIARVNSLVILLYIVYIPLYLFGLSGQMNIHRLFPIFDHSLSELTLAQPDAYHLDVRSEHSAVSHTVSEIPAKSAPDRGRRLNRRILSDDVLPDHRLACVWPAVHQPQLLSGLLSRRHRPNWKSH